MGFSLGGLVGKIADPFDITGSRAAEKAAKKATGQAIAMEERMFEKSQAFQKEMWDWQKEQAAPWREAGLGALGQYEERLGRGFTFDPSSDPVYQARLEEQSKAFGASGAARGMQLSGGTLRGLRDITGAELGASYGRQFDKYQADLANLGNLINVGQGMGMNLAGLGSQYGAQQQQAFQQFGAGQAQGLMNLGAIKAQGAIAPFQNMLSLGQVGAGLMSGAGAMGFKPFG